MTVELTTLPNGLRVVSESMNGLETTSIGVWVDVGARSETPQQNGLSHMLEHMAFKGTTRRSARQIAEEIEDVGGHLNAYTSREQTAYFARVLGGDVPLAVEILSDILQNSTFEAVELERERGVIIQEIGEAHDTPDDLVFDLMQEAAFPEQSVGRPILGTVETVNSFSRSTLADYMSRHYGAGSMVLAAAGKIDHAQLVSLATRYFGDMVGRPARAPEAARYAGGDRRVERALEQVHLTVGFPGLSYSDDRIYAAQIFSSILGGGMSSRLFQEVRENRGLAYSVYSFSSSLMDAGLFGIYAGTSPEQSVELLTVIAEEVKKVATTITDDEFARARAQLKSSTLMALESSAGRAEQMARQLQVYGRIVPLSELIERLDAVAPKDVCDVAQSMLAGGNTTLSAVGPLAQVPEYDVVRQAFAA